MESTNTDAGWRVANYQIPVPIGDCSAHFLLDKEKKVQKAFLMDGGTNADGYYAWVQILKGLWVVTHWDEDHYRGVRDLLSSDLNLFRFNQKGKGIPTDRTPSSTFSEQYFRKEPWLLCGALDFVMFFNRKKEFDMNFLKPFRRNLHLPPFQGYKPFFEAAEPVSTSQSSLLIELAGLRCIAGETLVGLDLFTRTRLFNLDGKHCSASQDPTEIRPRFCVMGANGYGLGNENARLTEPTRNETSILAILYWPNTGHCSHYTGGDGSPQVAKDIVTEWLSKPSQFSRDGQVDLMKLDHHGSTKENLGCKKPATTTNEAVTDTSEEATKKAADIITDILIEKLKPKGLLVTPGTQHGHPTWDVLLAIYKYFGGLEETDGLFTTRSFYWLDTNKPPAIKNLNFNHNEIEYMQAMHEKVYDSYHPGVETEGDDDEDTKDNKFENLQEVYQRVYDSYRTGNELREEDDEVTLHDLIILDQPARVEIQAKFENEKKKYGNLLKAKNEPDILKKKGKIDWGKVQELLTKTCRGLLELNPKELERALENSAHGVWSSLFWAWHSWVWHVEDALLDGAVQYSDICWQPIISNGNPHFLIRFVFDNNGKDRIIEVFNDDGEYQFIKDSGSISRVATNLFVEDKAARWTQLVYSPLTLTTIFDVKDFDDNEMYKDAPLFKQGFSGNMRQVKLAINVLFNTNPVNPGYSKASSRKETKSTKLRVAKLDETIANYKSMSLVNKPSIDEQSKMNEGIAANLSPRSRRSCTLTYPK
ncbi:hypothetical protein DER45DRAFT_595940 [Fusarium avenaceum]|nr:hypothetical protein DER45DRAFT_595940 [Fusarium avenaceum]